MIYEASHDMQGVTALVRTRQELRQNFAACLKRELP